MKTRSIVVAAFALLASSSAFAQSTPPTTATLAPATAPAMAPAAPAPTLTKDGKPRMKDVRAQCRTEVQGGGLKGDARRQAMSDCIVKQRPDMADAMKCRMDPSLKGMDKDARRTAVKACVAKAKG